PHQAPDSPVPDYPFSLRQRGIEDKVVVQYVIDASGRAVLQSARVLVVRYRDFGLEVLRALLAMRFVAATLSGCAVRGRVDQPFTSAACRSLSSVEGREAVTPSSPHGPPTSHPVDP